MNISSLCSTVLIGILLSPPLAVAAEQTLPEAATPPATDNAAPDETGGGESAPSGELLPVPEPPQIPSAVQSGEPLEPEVTIIQREKETVEEYRVNGRLFKVKITPSAGPPYYLIDSDGDGVLETRSNDITDINIPQWVLFSW